MYKKIIFLTLILITGCSKAPLGRFQLSAPELMPQACRGIKLRGELTTTEFIGLFECLNNNGALAELKPLMIGTNERASISAKLYNEFFGQRLSLSRESVDSLKENLVSWNRFKEKTLTLRRVLESDTIYNLGDVLSTINDEQLLGLLHGTINKTTFIELVERTLGGLPYDQKEAFSRGLSRAFGKEQMDAFFQKWGLYVGYLNRNQNNSYDKHLEIIHTLAKKNIFAELQSIINSLSPEESEFMDAFISYQLNPKYRSLTILKDELHEKYIKNELDGEKLAELNKKLKEFHKTFPQSDIASLVQLLIALDRPMRSEDGKEDILSSLASLMKSFYTVVLLKLDIPSDISKENPPREHPFGPDHDVSKLFSKIVTLIYATREILTDPSVAQPVLSECEGLPRDDGGDPRLHEDDDYVIASAAKQSLIDEKILLYKLFGNLPEYSDEEDVDKLLKLKEAIEHAKNEDEKNRLQNELTGLINQTRNLYAYIIENSNSSILGKLLKDYTKTWIDHKTLKFLFMKEARRLAPPDAQKPELIKSLETVVTFRKTIPLIRSLKNVSHNWTIFLYQKVGWLNGTEPINILARINQSPSILREILESAGENDPTLFKARLEEAIRDFLVPNLFTPLIPLDEYLRRGDAIPDESYLTELAAFIKRYDGEYPTRDLFLMDALLKSYQANHGFFFGSKSYMPWKGIEPSRRAKLIASVTAPLIQLPAKLSAIDEAVSLLQTLHSENPPFVSGAEDFELINYWGEEIRHLPPVFIKLSVIPDYGSVLDRFIESSCSADKTTATAFFNLLNRVAVRAEDDQLANALFNSLFPLIEILFNDRNIIDSFAESKGVPPGFQIFITVFGSESLSKTIPPLLQDREATKRALLFLKKGLEREDGIYRAMKLFTNLLSSNN